MSDIKIKGYLNIPKESEVFEAEFCLDEYKNISGIRLEKITKLYWSYSKPDNTTKKVISDHKDLIGRFFQISGLIEPDVADYGYVYDGFPSCLREQLSKYDENSKHYKPVQISINRSDVEENGTLYAVVFAE